MADDSKMTDESRIRENWQEQEPFSVDQQEKDAYFHHEMKRLTEHHRRSCQAYDDIYNGLGGFGSGEGPAEEGPYLPVAIFKDLDLRSVPEEEVVRKVTSSGTTGQQVSKIYLDAETSDLQRRALASITGDFIGGKRIPMLIIDSPDVLRDRSKFSARGAGILGFSMMASRRFYALDENMKLDWESIGAFCEKAGDGPSFAFGFTFMIWQYLHKALLEEGRKLDLPNCYLIHGGGWKKLQDQRVSDEAFREGLAQSCGITKVSDYYGMAEQTGSIFMQCPCGHLHASIYSDIQALDPRDLTPCETGQWGLLALKSWLPGSYPGHRLLTEDWGRLLGTDDCPCGRKGRYFEITGRISKAEIRGCSDTFGAQVQADGDPDKDLDVLAGTWPPEEDVMDSFDPLAISFLEDLSQLFMKDPAYRQYPDVYALGFWCRHGHLQSLQKREEKHWNDGEAETAGAKAGEAAGGGSGRKGRGLVLHIAPSNMPTMFAYSWITALLAGDPNVVRLSGKEAQISEVILQGIRSLLDQEKYEPLKRRNAFIRFPRDHKALETISGRAAARMIWGGDATVARISAVPKAEDTLDIPFPDKYSIALMDAEAVAAMTDDELKMQAHLFCRDTYSADQNACSSPRSIFWITGGAAGTGTETVGTGDRENLDQVKQRWWDMVAEESKRYELQPWMATEKYRQLCGFYAEYGGRAEPVRTWGSQVYVIACREPDGMLPEGKLGTFYEFDLKDTEALMPLLTEKIQTVVCIGTDPKAFLEQVRTAGTPGVDRAVAAGEALEFDTVWDRKDLIDMLSR